MERNFFLSRTVCKNKFPLQPMQSQLTQGLGICGVKRQSTNTQNSLLTLGKVEAVESSTLLAYVTISCEMTKKSLVTLQRSKCIIPIDISGCAGYLTHHKLQCVGATLTVPLTHAKRESIESYVPCRIDALRVNEILSCFSCQND